MRKRKPKLIDPAKIGRKGGRARAKALTPEQRSDSARKAAAARWAKPKATALMGRDDDARESDRSVAEALGQALEHGRVPRRQRKEAKKLIAQVKQQPGERD